MSWGNYKKHRSDQKQLAVCKHSAGGGGGSDFPRRVIILRTSVDANEFQP